MNDNEFHHPDGVDPQMTFDHSKRYWMTLSKTFQVAAETWLQIS